MADDLEAKARELLEMTGPVPVNEYQVKSVAEALRSAHRAGQERMRERRGEHLGALSRSASTFVFGVRLTDAAVEVRALPLEDS